MRCAIFDGILETHVVDSLVRALAARGHETFTTGKIGHGFMAVNDSDDISLLESNLDKVIDWKPDCVLVMRPASVTRRMLARLSSRGITTIAWLSDDPVLYEVSYGPVVDDYDIVLNCGTEKVLSFYDEMAGHPVGVNFPFFTDNVAFPKVWGAAEPLFDFMFLGNVHDRVRRRRYFDLSKLRGRLVHYGMVGTDYLGLSGGYLDSDVEVVAAGARARMAISVPQYFRDHRGLDTWFEGLDELGYFEYPSRVVQYMAMGIPTVSVVEGAPTFSTYPEMLVAGSFDELDGLTRDLVRDPDALRARSQATHERFVSCFSADSRVAFLEELVGGLSIAGLSAVERNELFTQFPPRPKRLPATEDDASGTATPIEVSHDRTTTTLTADVGDAVVDRKVTAPHGDEITPGPQDVAPMASAIVGMGWLSSTSTLMTLRRHLHDAATPVVDINPATYSDVVVPRGDGFRKSLALAKIEKLLDGVDTLYIVGMECMITEPSAAVAKARGVRTVMFYPKPTLSVRDLCALAGRCDCVVTPSYRAVVGAKAAGVTNVVWCPFLVDDASVKVPGLSSVPSTSYDSCARIRPDAACEEATVPGFAFDLAQPALGYADIDLATVEGIRQAFDKDLVALTVPGTKATPVLPDWFGFALCSAGLIVTRRLPVAQFPQVLRDSVVQVNRPGEFNHKLTLLEGFSPWANHLRRARRELIDTYCLASSVLDRVDDAVRATATAAQDTAENDNALVLASGQVSASARLAGLVNISKGMTLIDVTVSDAEFYRASKAEFSLTAAGRTVYSCPLGRLPGRLSVFIPADRLVAGVAAHITRVPSSNRYGSVSITLTQAATARVATSAPGGVAVSAVV